MAEVAKVIHAVPESVLKKLKRNEEWALAKKQDAEALKKKNAANRKLIFNTTKKHNKEYEAQQKELIQLKKEARLKGGFYVNPEAKYQCNGPQIKEDFATSAFTTCDFNNTTPVSSL